MHPDPEGSFNPSSYVLIENGVIYDCLMNRVEVGWGKYGDYLFYWLQIVREEVRDLWILFTWWGRIGEPGAN